MAPKSQKVSPQARSSASASTAQRINESLPGNASAISSSNGSIKASRSVTPEGHRPRGRSPKISHLARSSSASREAAHPQARDSVTSDISDFRLSSSGLRGDDSIASQEATAERYERQKQMISQYKEFLAQRRSLRLSQASGVAESLVSEELKPWHDISAPLVPDIAIEVTSPHFEDDPASMDHNTLSPWGGKVPRQNSTASVARRGSNDGGMSDVASELFSPHPRVTQLSTSTEETTEILPDESLLATAGDITSTLVSWDTLTAKPESPAPTQDAGAPEACHSPDVSEEDPSFTTLQFPTSDAQVASSPAPGPTDPPGTRTPPAGESLSRPLSQPSPEGPSSASPAPVVVSCLQALDNSNITANQLEELRDKRHIPPIPPVPPICPRDSVSSHTSSAPVSKETSPRGAHPAFPLFSQPIPVVPNKYDAVDVDHLEALQNFTRDIICQTVQQLSSETSRIDQRWRKVCLDAWARKYDELLDRLERIELRVAQLPPPAGEGRGRRSPTPGLAATRG